MPTHLLGPATGRIDRGVADRVGEAPDPASGVLVEVRGEAGECAGLVRAEVECVLHPGDEFLERFACSEPGREHPALDQGCSPGQFRSADPGEQRGGGYIDPGVHERRRDAFGEGFQQVRGLRTGGGVGARAVDLVGEDQADPRPVVGVTDRFGDPGLRHSADHGDAEAAGELRREGLRGCPRRDQHVRDRDVCVRLPGWCRAAACVGEVAGAPDVEERGGLPRGGGFGDDQRGAGGGVLVAAEDHQGPYGRGEGVDGGGADGDELRLVRMPFVSAARRVAGFGRRRGGCAGARCRAPVRWDGFPGRVRGCRHRAVADRCSPLPGFRLGVVEPESGPGPGLGGGVGGVVGVRPEDG